MVNLNKIFAITVLATVLVLGGLAYAQQTETGKTPAKTEATQTKTTLDPAAHEELRKAMQEMANAMRTMMNMVSSTCVTCHAQKAVLYQSMGESWRKWHEENKEKKGEQ